MTREDNGSDRRGRFGGEVTTRDNSEARRCLQDEFDQSGVPRKALADYVANGDESLFSKMVNGARPFDISELDKLPRERVIGWMKRYGREVVGAQVRDLEHAELTEELHALVDRIVVVSQMARRVGKPQQLKAELAGKESGRKAG